MVLATRPASPAEPNREAAETLDAGEHTCKMFGPTIPAVTVRRGLGDAQETAGSGGWASAAQRSAPVFPVILSVNEPLELISMTSWSYPSLPRARQHPVDQTLRDDQQAAEHHRRPRRDLRVALLLLEPLLQPALQGVRPPARLARVEARAGLAGPFFERELRGAVVPVRDLLGEAVLHGRRGRRRRTPAPPAPGPGRSRSTRAV